MICVQLPFRFMNQSGVLFSGKLKTSGGSKNNYNKNIVMQSHREIKYRYKRLLVPKKTCLLRKLLSSCRSPLFTNYRTYHLCTCICLCACSYVCEFSFVRPAGLYFLNHWLDLAQFYRIDPLWSLDLKLLHKDIIRPPILKKIFTQLLIYSKYVFKWICIYV